MKTQLQKILLAFLFTASFATNALATKDTLILTDPVTVGAAGYVSPNAPTTLVASYSVNVGDTIRFFKNGPTSCFIINGWTSTAIGLTGGVGTITYGSHFDYVVTSADIPSITIKSCSGTPYSPNITVNSFSGIATTTTNNTNIKLFPNPATTVLQVAIINEQAAQLKVYDVLGNTVITPPYTQQNGMVTFDVSALPSGVYFIKTQQGTAKFIKE